MSFLGSQVFGQALMDSCDIDASTVEGVLLGVLTISTHDTHKVLGAALEITFKLITTVTS